MHDPAFNLTHSPAPVTFQGRPLLLALGRLHQAKVIDVLLQALTLETRPYLWLAGEGPLRDDRDALFGAAAAAGPAAYVNDGEDGLLAPVDDAPALAAAIGRVIDKPALAAQLVAGGWRRYQDEFTEAACVARYLELFQKLLAERVGGEGAGAG